MKKKFFLSCLLIVMALLPAVAQIQDPVQFKTELKTISDTEAQIVFTGKIDAGWHVYSTDLPSGGPISATFNVDKIEGVELVGKLTPQGKEIENFDKVFEMKLRYFENTAIFIQKLKITGATYMIEGYMEFGACNDENCLPPTEVSFSFSGKGVAAATTSKTTERIWRNDITTRPFMDLHLLCRVYRWITCLIYALCMAYHPNDGKFLFKT